jgi:hypothetical protein
MLIILSIYHMDLLAPKFHAPGVVEDRLSPICTFDTHFYHPRISPGDEGMTPRSSIFAYPVPAKEEARSKSWTWSIT